MREIKKIIIEVIPHEEQRYETLGDYYFDDEGVLQIRISKMKENKHEMLVAVHELIEVLQTESNGVTEPAIVAFDKKFEERREPGNEDEPGDDPIAPYVKEHCIATAVERLMCALIGYSWKYYEEDCNSVGGSDAGKEA